MCASKRGVYKPEDALSAVTDTYSVARETSNTDFNIVCFDLHVHYPGRVLGHKHSVPENFTSLQTRTHTTCAVFGVRRGFVKL